MAILGILVDFCGHFSSGFSDFKMHLWSFAVSGVSGLCRGTGRLQTRPFILQSCRSQHVASAGHLFIVLRQILRTGHLRGRRKYGIKTPLCPKFVPAIVFGGSSQGDWNLSKICQNLSENYRSSNFDKFLSNHSPLNGNPKNNRWDKFWTNLGFAAFVNAVRGKGVRKHGNEIPW